MAYNILIVDDSAVVRKMLIRTFGMADVDVGNFFEAGNGVEGLEVLKNQWVDLVLLDINMPIMNGIQFMENVRGDKDLEATRVVVVSTEGSHDRIEELKRLGIVDYLRKPVTPEALVTTITKVLGEARHE